ncbi:alpha/beta hydrolase [Spirochaeta isovalerica]|uniref:Carboxylesterase n=1 Tax=Spirochaeta isovalerica TaxID=150 RepID=A0A841R8J8_9SPIO|nr:alpha/beta fold hydrolase [Spirochaeta isovalerica]MBB6480223.1 carboxylesterase [Spirochaeta isovalerica]
MVAVQENEINKAAEPRFLTGSRNHAVLIIHGFTGYPGEFYELAEELNSEGYTVSLPLLPGHGRNVEAFRKTNWRDWLNHVEAEYEALDAKYGKVSIVGLSMGGVLTLLLSSRFSPDRIALLAPAMAIKDNIFYLTPFLRFFLKKTSKDWKPEEGDSEDVRRLGVEYWSTNYINQIASLRKLQIMAGKRLNKVQAPALIMVSETDDTVPLKAASIIAKGLKGRENRTIQLTNSPHVLVSGPEKEYVKREVIKWIKGETHNE